MSAPAPIEFVAQAMTVNTRELWLARAVTALRPMFAAKGYTLPERVRASVGFPKTGKGKRGTIIGQCWDASVSGDASTEIFISPVLAQPNRVLDVLVHELCHAAVGFQAGHKKPFQTCASAMDLIPDPKWTGTSAGQGFLMSTALPVRSAIGFAFPHAEMTLLERAGKQPTRLIKCSCPGCGYTIRTTDKWLRAATGPNGEETGPPLCPDSSCNNWQGPMEVQ